MITCYQIKGVEGKRVYDINVDHNHDGYVYIKQGSDKEIQIQDWVIVDARMLDELINALVEVQNKGYFLDD